MARFVSNDLLETLLTGALAVQAVLFGIQGIFYTIHATLSAEALANPTTKVRPPARDCLRKLSRIVAFLALLTVMTVVLCFWNLAGCGKTIVSHSII
jgi:hypothetical protein